MSLTQVALLLLCVAWLLPGLVGHAPWRGGDDAHFVQLLDMLGAGLLPRAETAAPPLYYWVAAASAWMTSPLLPLHDGARLASGLFIALTLVFVMRTARAWYGAESGWAAVLVLLGCLGLLVRGHELNAYTAQFAAAAIMLYGIACLPRGPRGGAVLAGGAALMLLAGGAAEALVFLLLAAAASFLFDAHRTPDARRALGVAVGGTLVFAAAWVALLVVRAVPLAEALGLDRWLGSGMLRPAYYPGILAWFAWPAWPLAAWALYRERRQWRTPRIAVPALSVLVLLLLYAWERSPGDERGLILLLPLALLASAGLLTLRRGAANALLWFGIMLFGFIGLVFWVYWSAHDLGTPARLARRLVKLGLTGVGELRPWALVLGALATLVWLGIVMRVRRSALRPMLVWTSGMTFVWVLLMALFLGPLDRRLSYAGLGAELAARVPAGACIQARAVRDTQRRLLAYHSGRELAPAEDGCDWMLVETRQRNAEPEVTENWSREWVGARPGDRSDRYHLYVRR